MPDTTPHLKLTHDGAMKILNAAIQKADEMGQPQCIAIVDDGGHLLVFARINDAKPSSVRVAITKAVSAATRRAATGPLPSEGNASLLLSLGMPLASAGNLTCVRGGMPVVVSGVVVGGIGISAGTEAQDEEVAQAALKALG